VEVVRANGLEIAYRRAGQGPPLFLLHGAGEDGRLWEPQLAALADELTVVAWDEPGAGRSSDVPANFRLVDYARCLSALIEALALGPAHIAGLSWGGTVALELYRHRPELVATLIFIGARRSVRSHASRALRRRAAGAVRRAPRGDGRRRPAPEPEDAAVPDGRGRPARRAAPHRRADPPDLGELDTRSPLGVARQFERAIPDTTLVVIPGAGHVSNLERPERFDAAVREFCRAHRTP
jgi:pimeloyl-ACP methyl ester carboxylesterase